MAPGFGAEAPSVQNPILGYVSEQTDGLKWDYVEREQAEDRRGGMAGVFFYDSLHQKLLELNDWMDDSLAKEVIKRIANVRPTIDGNQELLSWLRGRQSIHHDQEKRERNVTLIDFDHPENNSFEVTEEWQYTNGRFTNRADIVFLINGVPVVLVEAKAAHKEEGVAEGVEQIRRYHEETPEMVTINQIFDVPNLLDWYYGVTWNTNRKNLFNWRDEQPGNYEQKVKAFFQRDRILKFIQDYILFIKSDDELQKYILRQHQTRAIEKGVLRSLEEEKRTGLFWHTQGSGKTFTMIVTAKKLLDQPELEKPTVLMLVDRNELESQLFQNLEGYGFGDVKIIESKADLKDTLRHDRRGLIVSMIHKFEGIPENICTRDNVFVLVDEAHRSTGGDFGNYLMAALPNATYFGFTGTPIDQTAYGKGTFKTFGRDDAPKGYLDKYSMAESIEDGTTLPLHYTLAPNDMLVNQETLSKEFLDLAESQGVSDVEELNRILERAVTLKTQMKAHDRIEKVAGFVAKHFRENVEPMGYKAFLVGVDREACALYKKALDQHLPAEYSRVVYSPSHNDRALLKEFHLSIQEEKDIRKAFKRKSDLPKILIITDKLLTGFNAPLLYCMYLDKPMRDHVLLQCIARVNRPYEDSDGLKKPVGFILDFVGIFEKLDKALAFDSDEVSSVIQDIDLIRNEFEKLMKDRAGEYLKLVKGKSTDKDFEEAVEFFAQKEKRDEFFKLFKTIESFYEILSPDAFLGPFIEDYNNLARLYFSIRNAYKKRIYVDRELMAKTKELVRQNVSAEGFTGALPIQTIDENTLTALKQSKSTNHVKVINLIKTIRITIDDEGGDNPFLISIGERADAIAEMYEDRQLNTEKALRKLEVLIREYNEALQEWKKKGLDIDTFSIYWLLQKSGLKKAEKLAVEVNAVFNSNPNWKVNGNEFRILKRGLYKVLMKPVGKDRIKQVTDQLLRVRKG